jgi:hypothetical protein
VNLGGGLDDVEKRKLLSIIDVICYEVLTASLKKHKHMPELQWMFCFMKVEFESLKQEGVCGACCEG